MCSDFFALVLTRRPELKDLLLKPVAPVFIDPRVTQPAANSFAEPAAPIQGRSAPKQATAPRLLSIRARIEGVPYIPLESFTKPWRPTGIPAAKATSTTPVLQQNIHADDINASQEISDNEAAVQSSQLPSLLGAAADGYSSDAETADEQTTDIAEELRIRSDPDYISSLSTLSFRDIKICQEQVPSRRGTYDGVLSLSPCPYALNATSDGLTSDAPRRASTPGSPHDMHPVSPRDIPASRVRCCSSCLCAINAPGGGGGGSAAAAIAIDAGLGTTTSRIAENYHSGGYDVAQSDPNRSLIDDSPSLRNLAAAWDRPPSVGDMRGLLQNPQHMPLSAASSPTPIFISRGSSSSCTDSSRDPIPRMDHMRHHRRQRPCGLDRPGSAHLPVPRQLARTSPHDPLASGKEGSEGLRGETDNGCELLETSEVLARKAEVAGSPNSQSSQSFIDSQLISRLLQDGCQGLEAFLPSGGRAKLVARRLRQLRSQLLRSPAKDAGTHQDDETELDVAVRAEGDVDVDVELDAGADIKLGSRQGCANVLLRMESSPARMMRQRPKILSVDASGPGDPDGDGDGDGDGDSEGEGEGGGCGGAGCNNDDADGEDTLTTSRPREARAKLRVATTRLYTPAVLDLQLQLQQQQQQQQHISCGRISQVSLPARAPSPVPKPAHGQAGGVAATEGDASGGDVCDGVGAAGAVGNGAGNGSGVNGGGSAAHVGRQSMQLPVRQPQPPLLPYGGILRLAVANGSNGLPFALVHPRASWQPQQHGRSPKRISGRREGSGGPAAAVINNPRGTAGLQSLGSGFSGGDLKTMERCASPPPGAAGPGPVVAAVSPFTALLRSSDTGSVLRPDSLPYGRLAISASDGDYIAGCASPLEEAPVGETLKAASPAASAAITAGCDGQGVTLRLCGVQHNSNNNNNSRPAPATPPPPPLLPSLRQQKGLRAMAFSTNRHRRSGGDVPPLTPTGQNGKYDQRKSFNGSGGGGIGGFAGEGGGGGGSGGGLGSGRIAVGSTSLDQGSNISASGAAATAAVAVVLAVADGSATSAESRQYRQYKLGFTAAIAAPAVSPAIMRHSSTEVNQGRASSLLPVINHQPGAGRSVPKLHPGAAVPFPNFMALQLRAPE